MTLAFLVPRKGYLKVMGALIQAALDRRHSVVLLWDPHEAKPGETVKQEDLRAWPDARAVTYQRRAPLAPVLRAAGVQALVGPSLYYGLNAFGHGEEIADIRAAGVRLFSVDYVLDTVTTDPRGYLAMDTTFYTSEYHRELHWRVKADGFAEIGGEALWRERSAVCGSTMLDQLAMVDRAAVRKRYGLRDEQPVVLFMSLKMAVPDPWRRLAWGGGWRVTRAARAALTGHAAFVPQILRRHGYRDLVEAAQRFARREGAAFIVKSREKNDDPVFVGRGADAFVFDDAVFPYTSMELMAIADLCIHFQSGAAIEAAFAGVPSLTLRVSQTHISQYASFDELYGGRPGTLQNFPGVAWPADGEAAAALLDRASLADFRMDPAARRRYVDKFLGFDDTRSSHRVLDVIEARARAV